MAHLGSQTVLPEGSKRKLSGIPTRIMSTIIDNEVFNQDPKIGSVEDGGDGSHPYQDFNYIIYLKDLQDQVYCLINN